MLFELSYFVLKTAFDSGTGVALAGNLDIPATS